MDSKPKEHFFFFLERPIKEKFNERLLWVSTKKKPYFKVAEETPETEI